MDENSQKTAEYLLQIKAIKCKRQNLLLGLGMEVADYCDTA
jgi:hypothetical protein